MLRFDLQLGFPAVTTKMLAFKSAVGELIGFIRASRSAADFRALGCKVWDQNANANKQWLENPYRTDTDDLGPVYGRQWRDFGGVDQIQTLIDMIRKSPDSRRLIVSAWNPPDVPQMALPPCHTMWQVRILGGKLHLQLYQRSADMFLGVPFNIASYALLLVMLAHVTGYEPGDFIHSIGDAHIYSNHMDQVQTQLSRDLRPLPTLRITRTVPSIFDFRYEDFEITGYDPHPAIKAPVAV